MVKKCIRGWNMPCVHTYAKANNKYMRYYDPNTESSYHMYWNVNDLYRQAMRQKLHVAGFSWKNKNSNFFEKFTQNCDGNSDKE